MTKNNQSSLINILKNGNPNNKAIVVPGGYSFSYTEIIENVNYLIKQRSFQSIVRQHND